MKNLEPLCDCLFTNHEDPICAAMHAADSTLVEAIKREEDFLAYLVSRYGPSENID